MSEQSDAQKAENNDQLLWRGAIIPSAIISLLCIVIFTVIRHQPGLWGSGFASVVVLMFFSIHLLVARISRDLDPMVTMALAMFSYFAKVILVGALLLVVTRLTSPETVDRGSFGISAIAITLAWLTGEIRAFLRLRFQLPLPPSSPQN
jgi:ATP synthase protein I